MPVVPQTLDINNSRTTRPKSINLHTIRKLIKYSLKKVSIKAIFSPTNFKILMSQGRSVLSPTQQGTGSERDKMLMENPDIRGHRGQNSGGSQFSRRLQISQRRYQISRRKANQP